jgi:glutathione S-transferase
MQLIGMLDSPYVRRTAITMHLLDLPFEHKAASVFRHFDQFAAINPVVKAPTLVLDDGSCLMDSTLIIDYAECLAGPARSLMPSSPAARARALRSVGLALAACEKTAQIVYEQQLRPEEKQHQPWLDRVRGQLLAAYGLLEREHDDAACMSNGRINQAGITAAVTWAFTRHMLPDALDAASFPRLAAWSASAEALPVFRSYPLA